MVTPSIAPTPQRPSVGEQLKTAAASPLTPVTALLVALSSAFGAFQAYQGSQATARAGYEALKVASETNTAAIEACRKGQLDLRTWVEDISERVERRQVTTETAIKRKVNKPAAPPIAATPVEPAPKAPPAPVATTPASLPAFEALKAGAQ